MNDERDPAFHVTTHPTNRPRVYYVSYDGMAEPLGRSQVLAYLFRLAPDYDITLFSFEKPGSDLTGLHAELAGHGVEWHPLHYHRRPAVLSTLVDVVAGVLFLRRATRQGGPPAIIHVRSYVPALIALWARRFTGGRTIFDIRGFWADERVEGGIWPPRRLSYRLLYRLAKSCEQRFFANADAVVTLTHASLPQIREWLGAREVPVTVIPTCVDLERFAGTTRRPDGPRALWCGSIGTWYRFDLVAPLTRALGLRLDVVTRQTEPAREGLGELDASISELPPDRVPEAMCEGDIGLCLVLQSFSKIASAPTRFAEHLAAGMPVVVTAGVGDLETIVDERRVGVTLRGEDEESLARAAREILALARDPATGQRCRRVAAELFDLRAGAAAYHALYRALV